jgi:hypothetical protein
MGDIAANQWQANVYTRTFIDDNKNGVYDTTQPPRRRNFLPSVTVRYRDGSLSNNLVTDFNGTANFNETFPLFNWYVVETDTTRYKNTGIHTCLRRGRAGRRHSLLRPNGCRLPAVRNDRYPFGKPSWRTRPKPSPCPPTCRSGRGLLRHRGLRRSIHSEWAAAPLVPVRNFDRPHRSALGSRRLAGLLRPEQLHRIRQGTLRGRRERRHQGPCGLCLHPSLRRSANARSDAMGASGSPRHHQPLPGRACPDGVTPTLTWLTPQQTSSWDDWAQGFRADGVATPT